MQNPTIRRATAADAALLAELSAQTFYDTYIADNTPENISFYMTATFGDAQQAAELADPSSTFLIADIDGVAVGYAKLHISEPPTCVTGPSPIELARIYAAKDWIGKGVGSVLMQACLTEAKQQGCETIWLGVWERNLRGQAFYRKWEFVQVGTQIFKLGDDPQTDFVLQRPL